MKIGTLWRAKEIEKDLNEFTKMIQLLQRANKGVWSIEGCNTDRDDRICTTAISAPANYRQELKSAILKFCNEKKEHLENELERL